MKCKLTLFNSIFALFILSACGDILEDYQSSVIDPMPIDENICNILNETESVTAYTFSNDSLSIVSLFDSLVQDTSTFITLSNVQNWRIPVDSISYFMVFAPQEADSYFVALNSSSEFQIYNSEGNVIVASDSITSLKNVAGCSDVRTRKVYCLVGQLPLAGSLGAGSPCPLPLRLHVVAGFSAGVRLIQICAVARQQGSSPILGGTESGKVEDVSLGAQHGGDHGRGGPRPLWAASCDRPPESRRE